MGKRGRTDIVDMKKNGLSKKQIVAIAAMMNVLSMAVKVSESLPDTIMNTAPVTTIPSSTR